MSSILGHKPSIGTKEFAFAISTLDDGEFNINMEDSKGTFSLYMSSCLTTSGIRPIAFSFTPSPQEVYMLLPQILKMTGGSTTLFKRTLLPPGPLPIHWGFQRRDLQASRNFDPNSLVHLGLPNPDELPAFIHGLEVVVRKSISVAWGSNGAGAHQHHSDTAKQSRNHGHVALLGMFAIICQPALGHRDFVRVLIDGVGAFHVDQVTSLIVQSIFARNNAEDTQVRSENICWQPRPMVATRYLVTYVVLPDTSGLDQTIRDGISSSTGIAHSEQSEASIRYTTDKQEYPCGVHVTATEDIVVGSHQPNQDPKTVYYEVIKPKSKYPSTKQFFVPEWSALTF